MRLVIEKAPARRLMGLPPKARIALLERLKSIAADPFAQQANVAAFKGERDVFRLRQGDWRAVYRMDREADEMRVGAIEPRGAGVPMNAIHPIATTDDTVTLSRAGFEALLEALEDAEGIAALRAAEARVTAGEGEYLPVEMVERLLSGENPVKVWRKHRGITAKTMAAAAGISAAYLSEIESGKKPGSFDAMAKLAKALGISLDDLAGVVEPVPNDRAR